MPPPMPPRTGGPGVTGGISLRRSLTAFRNRHFTWLWGSTAASFAGMQMQLIARGVLAWDLSHSYAVVGLVEASFALPMAVFALPGGAAVDRVEKRQIVLFSQGVMGVLGMGTAFLIQTHVISIFLLFMVGVIQGSLFSFNGPARMALLTEIVDDDELTASIALQNIAMNATRIVGPTVAAVVISAISIAAAYYVTGVTYLFTVLAMLMIPKTTGHIGIVRQTIPREIGDGLRHVFGDHTRRSLMLSALVLTLFIMPYRILLPGFADKLGHTDLYGVMMTVTGVGGLIGSIVIAAVTEFPRKPLLQLAIGLFSALSLAGLGVLSGPFGVSGALVALLLLGIGSTAYMTLNQTMLMTQSEKRYHGRVMSIFMETFSAMPLMSLPLGFFADRVGAANLFIMQGVLVGAALIALALAVPSFTFSVEGGSALLPEDEPVAIAERPLEFAGASDDDAAGAG